MKTMAVACSLATSLLVALLSLAMPDGARAQELPRQLRSGPEGLVAVGGDPKAMAVISHFTMPSIEMVQAFIEPSDKMSLDAGETAVSARYVFVSRFRDLAHQLITPAQFQSLVQQLRAKSEAPPNLAGMNMQLAKRTADLPAYKNIRIDKFTPGAAVFDELTCFAKEGQASHSPEGATLTQYMVFGFYRIDGRLFMVTAYAHAGDEDIDWLSNQGTKWLRGLCAGGHEQPAKQGAP